MSGKNVGIAAEGHGPVEVIFRWVREDIEPVSLASDGLVIQENVALIFKTISGQFGGVIVVGMEDNGVALVDKTLVDGGDAVGVATASGDERLLTQTKTIIFPVKESGPQQDFLLYKWYDFRSLFGGGLVLL